MDQGTACPACGSRALQPAGWGRVRRAVCARCGHCWERQGRGHEVDTLACPGCPRRGTCESCPTGLVAEMSERHVLPDGEQILIRPLLYGDRFELAAGFDELSLRSRRARFFDPPDELDGAELEYLTNIDYHDHYACAALAEGGPVPVGIGVARYVREADDPTTAEVAVTVADDHQRRGVGTLLSRALARAAVANGIRRFVSYVLWDNAAAIDMFTAQGTRVSPAEPGVARIEIDLPARADEVAVLPDTYLHRLFATFAARVRAWSRAGSAR